MKVGIKIRDDIILELEWIRYTDPDTLIDVDTRVAKLTLQNDEIITWVKEVYGKTMFYTKNIRSYQFTRGLKKKILAEVFHQLVGHRNNLMNGEKEIKMKLEEQHQKLK